MKQEIIKLLFFFLITLGFVIHAAFRQSERDVNYLSPSDLCIDNRGKYMYITQQTKHRIDAVDIKKGKVKNSLEISLPPKSIIQNEDDLLVAASYSEGELLVIDKKTLKLKNTIKVGKGACDVVSDHKNGYAYVANQFSNDVSFVNLTSGKEEIRIKVLRQPMVLEISKDGRYLFVANFITDTRADIDTVTSKISIIDIAQRKKIKDIPLANGSNALRGIAVSDDGKYVFISHNLGRFQVPTSQLEQGWMNTSALSVIDVNTLEYVATVLLDEPYKGAAGSWGIDCNVSFIVVAHSGTHDFSIIDYRAFIEKLNNHPDKKALDYDLRFLTDLRTRVKVDGNGPRSIVLDKSNCYITNYFSDNINVFNTSDLSDKYIIMLNNDLKMDSARLGEMYFHDAQYCFQQWQSCTGCHPNNARTDGLNWDLLNDGIGNPKNCKSMVVSHITPPAMVTGIRPTAEIAVRAGFKYIQFAEVSEGKSKAVDLYLKSLKPVPSPYLINGKLSEKARRGKIVFENRNCGLCHPPPYFTDMQQHEMGIQGEFDHQNSWDTPTLIEVWRTGPYLHDGRSATMNEVFSEERHGISGEISNDDLDCLVEYIMSI